MAYILVIDDSTTIRFKLIGDLSKEGHKVISATNGLEGLMLISQNPDLDLVICDVNMPKMSGLDMYQKVKEQDLYVNKPIFMITGEIDDDIIERGKSLGVHAWISKPYDRMMLIERINETLHLTSR